MSTSNFIWRPEEHAWTRDSHVARFMRTRGIGTLSELRQASVQCHQWFWDEALRDMGLEWTRRYTQVRDMSRGVAWTRWFVGGEINVTHNCIDRHVRDGHGAETALFYEGESGRPGEMRRMSFAELAEKVNCCVLALRAAGVQRGDSVALYAPMQVPAVVVMFAAMKMGARFVPISCGLARDGLRERLAECGAKVLFAAQRLARDGGMIETGAAAGAAASELRSIGRVVWTDTEDWGDFLASGGCMVRRRNPLASGHEAAVACERTEAEEPCLILHTRGTAGRSKGTVHTHAGCLAQMGKELRYGFDVRPGEPFLWVTDISGLMGPWGLIGCLLYRTPVVLLDGAANLWSGDRLWETCARVGVVTLGCSPNLVRSSRRAEAAREGRGPGDFDLGKLRVLGATGEVWDAASYCWFFEKVGGGRCPVMNLATGTEIAGSYLQPYPLEPLKPCSSGGGGLGLDVGVVTAEGTPTERGTAGHLVCKQPAPSMTKSLLGGDALYLETYYSRFRGTWESGDQVEVDEDGQWFVRGWSEDMFEVDGKWVGPAEIEDALMSHPAVTEAVAIVLPNDVNGTAIVAFVVAKPGEEDSANGSSGHAITEAELIQQVVERRGRPWAPKHVWVVEALPKTWSGTVVRGAIARVFQGHAPGDLTHVKNPEALEAIGMLAQLQHA